VAALLHEAAETHHRVYRLTRLSELPELLGRAPVKSELVYMLVQLDKDFVASQPGEGWEREYAARLLEHFAH